MPFERLQKWRSTQAIRDSRSEVSLSIDDFVQPFFISKGERRRVAVPQLPQTEQLSVDEFLKDIDSLEQIGIKKVILFPSTDPSDRDATGTQSYSRKSPVVQAIKQIKKHHPSITVFSDVCLCAHTSHGHCGLFKNGAIANDETLPILGKIALSHAEAGVDYVCPSSMMDGQVRTLRKTLDKHLFFNTKILSYTAKYASSFYGPFRIASGASDTQRDRRTYQMDPRNVSQILLEFEADRNEGADAFIVKPAHTYLDVLLRIRQNSPQASLFAYHVSGECALLEAANTQKAITLLDSLEELFYAFKRSGANSIISYYSRLFCSELKLS